MADRYRHKKTGGLYTVLARGQMQTGGWVDSHGYPDDNGNYVGVDMAEVVIYQGGDGSVWVRPVAEFTERFEVVT